MHNFYNLVYKCTIICFKLPMNTILEERKNVLNCNDYNKVGTVKDNV